MSDTLEGVSSETIPSRFGESQLQHCKSIYSSKNKRLRWDRVRQSCYAYVESIPSWSEECILKKALFDNHEADHYLQTDKHVHSTSTSVVQRHFLTSNLAGRRLTHTNLLHRFHP